MWDQRGDPKGIYIREKLFFRTGLRFGANARGLHHASTRIRLVNTQTKQAQTTEYVEKPCYRCATRLLSCNLSFYTAAFLRSYLTLYENETFRNNGEVPASLELSEMWRQSTELMSMLIFNLEFFTATD